MSGPEHTRKVAIYFLDKLNKIGLALGVRAMPTGDVESPARRSYRAGLGSCSLVEIVNDAAVRWIDKMHATVSVIIAVSAH